MSGWHRKGRLTIRVHIGGSPSSVQRVVQGVEWSYTHTVALFSAIPWPWAKRGTMSCMDDLKKANMNMSGSTQHIKQLALLLCTINTTVSLKVIYFAMILLLIKAFLWY